MLTFKNLSNLYYDPNASLEAGIKANSPTLIRAALLAGADATIGLRKAIYNTDAARILIDEGHADINAIHFDYKSLKDNFKTGSTILHMAAYEGLAGIVNLLILRNALPNLPSFETRSKEAIGPMSYAAAQSRFTVQGDTPLHCAAQANEVMIARRLLGEHLVQVNATNANNETPLHQAANADHTDVGRVLLAAGASTQARTSSGFTASEIADHRVHRQLTIRALVSNLGNREGRKAGAERVEVTTPESQQPVRKKSKPN